jgi:thiosulfate reductase/polysulfide reductase chain A
MTSPSSATELKSGGRSKLSRRSFLQISGVAGLGATAGAVLPKLSSEKAAASASNSASTKAGTTDDAPRETKTVASFCEMCFWKCGILCHIEDGRLKSITGNPEHPLSRGRLCPRGTGGAGLVYDRDRLTTPLIRVGKRGEEKFREATWEEALDRIAEGFGDVAKKHGPEALALLYHGKGSSFFKTLFRGLGSKNIAAPSFSQCRGPREVGFELTFGEGLGSPAALDMQNSRALVLLGSHLGENMHNTQVQDFAEAVSNDCELIVVDPRFSVAAGKAKHWLPIRPGTDVALLLGWMHVILREGWYDKEWLAKNSTGLDKLEKHVASYYPEAVYVETGIHPDQLVATARAMSAAAPHALIHPGRRTTWYGDDTQRMRAIAMLNALLGNWGQPGGFVMTTKSELKGDPSLPKFPEAKPAADREPGEYPLVSDTLAFGIREATRKQSPYPIKAWMVYGSNLPTIFPNEEETLEAIQQLDFMVAIDVLPSEVCGWADVVLPEASYLERHDDLWNPYYREPFVALRQPAVKPIGDSKPGWWIAKQLGKRMGLDKYFPWNTPVELIQRRLKASGYTREQVEGLMQDGVIKTAPVPSYLAKETQYEFGTPSGKIEFYSEQLASIGQDPMPVYRRPVMPSGEQLRLLTGRAPTHTFGRTTNNELLLQAYPENDIWVHLDVAERLGLKSGDYVMLSNQDGAKEGPIKLKATSRIRPGCAYMVHGFGHKAKQLRKAHGVGADDNALMTDYKVDPIAGTTGINVNFVTLEKVEA